MGPPLDHALSTLGPEGLNSFSGSTPKSIRNPMKRFCIYSDSEVPRQLLWQGPDSICCWPNCRNARCPGPSCLSQSCLVQSSPNCQLKSKRREKPSVLPGRIYEANFVIISAHMHVRLDINQLGIELCGDPDTTSPCHHWVLSQIVANRSISGDIAKLRTILRQHESHGGFADLRRPPTAV